MMMKFVHLLNIVLFLLSIRSTTAWKRKCSANPRCKGLSGNCCPTRTGLYLNCCDRTPVTSKPVPPVTRRPTKAPAKKPTKAPVPVPVKKPTKRPTRKPTTAPVVRGKTCSSNPLCVALGLTGDCCPTTGGTFLDCCNRQCSSNPKCVTAGLTGACCPTINGVFLDCCK